MTILKHARSAWPSVAALLLACALMAAPRDGVANEVAAWNEATVTALLSAGHDNVVLTRGLTMAQVAVHDALNAIARKHEAYAYDGTGDAGASPDAAIATAARDVLLFAVPQFGTPTQQAAAIASVDTAYAASLGRIADGPAKTAGIAVGRAAAVAIVEQRRNDGAMRAAMHPAGTTPGHWRPHPNPVPADPPVPNATLAAGYAPAVRPLWGDVTPFTLLTAAQFRLPGPPALPSEVYTRDYNEVKSLGAKAGGSRNAEQSQVARYWYEASPIGWNRIARVVATARGLDAWQQARLLALVNVAMADGFIAGWHARYPANFWRPVTAIREGENDGNPATAADRGWESLLNTPAIPEYPSTHAILGAAAAAVLAEVLASDQVEFSMTSGAPFAGITRSFTTFSQAAAENADSRVYAGVHFRSSCRDGLALGQRIGRRAARMYLLAVSP